MSRSFYSSSSSCGRRHISGPYRLIVRMSMPAPASQCCRSSPENCYDPANRRLQWSSGVRIHAAMGAWTCRFDLWRNCSRLRSDFCRTCNSAREERWNQSAGRSSSLRILDPLSIRCCLRPSLSSNCSRSDLSRPFARTPEALQDRIMRLPTHSCLPSPSRQTRSDMRYRLPRQFSCSSLRCSVAARKACSIRKDP